MTALSFRPGVAPLWTSVLEDVIRDFILSQVLNEVLVRIGAIFTAVSFIDEMQAGRTTFPELLVA